MRIIHVAAECSHIAKAGGLGDVVYGLAKEQAKNHHVEVILPKYDTIAYCNLTSLKVSTQDLWSIHDGQRVHNSAWSDVLDSINITLIEPHHKDYFFSRGHIYGQKDDTTRFLYFARAVYELLILHRQEVDIIHLHDWQAAPLALLLKTFCPEEYNLPRIVYTIHNFRFHGLCAASELLKIGIRAQDYLYEQALQDPIKLSMINLSKAGLKYSDVITTVSNTYAKEIQTKLEGYGLEEFVKERSSDLFGIINGIDYDQYNPAEDKALFQRYSSNPSFIDKISLAKLANKKHLLDKLDMPYVDNRPLIVSITRIDEQKGLEFFKEALKLAKTDPTFTYVLLGSCTTQEQKMQFDLLKKAYTPYGNIHMHLSFNQELAHLLYASADMILIPSISEPCGLTQMIAMRYGTIAIAHATGGLKDTIDSDCGFLYLKPTIKDFTKTLLDAINVHKNHSDRFKKMQKNALLKDFSFKKVAQSYEALYLKKKATNHQLSSSRAAH